MIIPIDVIFHNFSLLQKTILDKMACESVRVLEQSIEKMEERMAESFLFRF